MIEARREQALGVLAGEAVGIQVRGGSEANAAEPALESGAGPGGGLRGRNAPGRNALTEDDRYERLRQRAALPRSVLPDVAAVAEDPREGSLWCAPADLGEAVPGAGGEASVRSSMWRGYVDSDS